MRIIQQISDNPITGSKREVYLLSEFVCSGQADIKSGNLIFPDISVEAQYQVIDYREVNGEKKYSNPRFVTYRCSDTAKIVPTAEGLLYVTDPSFPNFEVYPAEKAFVLSLKYKSSISIASQEIHFNQDQETILRMFIDNLDTRTTGSIFNIE